MLTFFRVCGRELGENPNETAFNFLLRKFRSTLSDSSAPPKEASLAVQGYGHLAAACARILRPEDVTVMLGTLLQRTEQVRRDTILEWHAVQKKLYNIREITFAPQYCP